MSWRKHHFELDNEIHPIFAKHNFPGIDYAKIVPTLRLASNLLTAKPLLAFWHAIFFGEERTLSPEEVLHADKDELPKSFWRRSKVLSSRSEALTNLRLVKLASLVKFYCDDSRNTCNGYGGICFRHEGNEVSYSEYDYPGCSGSSVYYSKAMFDAATRDFQPIAQRDCVPCLQNVLPIFASRFLLASLLVHEIAHAAVHYVLPTTTAHEDFFEDYTLAESGYAWEVFAFGGMYQPYTLQTITGLPMYDDFLIDFNVYGDMEFLDCQGTWNTGTDLSKRCRHHHDQGIRNIAVTPLLFTPFLDSMKTPDGDLIPYRAGTAASSHIPYVAAPSSFLCDLFTPSFWSKTVEMQGADALNVVKRAEWAFLLDKKYNDWGPWACFDHDPDTEAAGVEGVEGWVPVPGEGIQGLARKRNGFDELVGPMTASEMMYKQDAEEVRARMDRERLQEDGEFSYASW